MFVEDEVAVVIYIEVLLGRAIIVSCIIVIYVAVSFVAERPGIAYVETCGVIIGERTILDLVDGRIPIRFVIWIVPMMYVGVVLVMSNADLAAHDLHMGVAEHLSVLGAAIDGGGDERRAADFQIGGIGNGKKDG